VFRIFAFFCVIMLALAGCAKKPVAKNDLRTVTTEVVAAAQKITNNKSQIIVRPQAQASKRGGSGAADDIYISLVTPAEAVTLKQSLADRFNDGGVAGRIAFRLRFERNSDSFDSRSDSGFQKCSSDAARKSEGAREWQSRDRD